MFQQSPAHLSSWSGPADSNHNLIMATSCQGLWASRDGWGFVLHFKVPAWRQSLSFGVMHKWKEFSKIKMRPWGSHRRKKHLPRSPPRASFCVKEGKTWPGGRSWHTTSRGLWDSCAEPWKPKPHQWQKNILLHSASCAPSSFLSLEYQEMLETQLLSPSLSTFLYLFFFLSRGFLQIK